MRLARGSLTVLGLAALVWAGTGDAPAQPKLIRLTFYCPVGVAEPLAKVIVEMTDQFNKRHPGHEVVPVYSHDYDPTLRKVQVAVMADEPDTPFSVITLKNADA